MSRQKEGVVLNTQNSFTENFSRQIASEISTIFGSTYKQTLMKFINYRSQPNYIRPDTCLRSIQIPHRDKLCSDI